MNGQHLLRGHEDKSVVFDAIDIPNVGFGTDKIMRRMPGAGLVSTTRQKIYRMSCHCLIQVATECGPPCNDCLIELMTMVVEIPELACVTPEQWSWRARPCHKHHQICMYPLCGKSGCSRHIAMAPDERMYCTDHFIMISEKFEIRDLVESKGLIRASITRFIRWIFREPKLP